MPSPAHATTAALPPGLTTSADLGGLAALGKVAFVLLLILAIIFASMWLLRRFGPTHGTGTKNLKIVSAKAVGSKERVVVLEVEDTWLVLGVTANHISKLHELPARETPATPSSPTNDRFSRRFAAALKQNLRGGRS